MEKINSIKTLGNLIRQTRIDQGLTQEQLAASCGFGLRFIREVEQGKETCHIGKVLYVMQMLGIDFIAKKRGGLYS